MAEERHMKNDTVELHLLGAEQGQSSTKAASANIFRDIAQMRIVVQEHLEESEVVVGEGLIVSDYSAGITLTLSEVSAVK